ncbi:hypothetical protein [Bacteroides caecimuris]|uniref:hypothetical protein n=1 Tax=Bacteroides caecimuris TaxID=1796613 RepID=UPI002570D4DB|nr:hypothetical protein [Bacteroides caecimuris]
MKDKLIEILQPLGFPIKLQGSMSQDEVYPDSFFTFWNNATYDDAFYDNEEHRTIWDFDLNFYSEDPALVNEILISAKRLLKQAGFIVNGKGYDVPSDEVTHTGRGINILYMENQNNKEEN